MTDGSGFIENLPSGGKYLKVVGPFALQSTGFSSDTGIALSVASGLVGAGTTIADALQLASFVNRFATVASGAGAKLFLGIPIGAEAKVINQGANALLLYPPTATETINGGSVGASVSIAATELAIVTRTSTLNFDVRIAVVP